ncbi:MAG: tetratricopeptide repeat protein [Phycisphaerales bacterium]
MALFGWKKSSDPAKAGGDAASGGKGANGSGGGEGGSGPYEFSPEKASRWFHHARTSGEAGNHEYALTCWLSGLRFEPTNLEAMDALFSSAASHAAQNGPGVPKAVAKAVAGKTDVDRYLTALLEFVCKTSDAEAGVRAAAAASDVGLTACVNFLAPIALKVLLGAPKARKDQYTRVMAACVKAGSYEYAVKAGEGAMRLDPADSRLATEVRNLAAQGTMTKGGYDQTGEAGGFRSNIRDAARQQQLDEQERLVRSESVQDRTIEVAKEEYQARPTDRPTVKKYAEELLKRGRVEDLNAAHDVLMKGYRDTQEFRFRVLAGEIKIKLLRAQQRQAAAAAAENPSDPALAARVGELQKSLLALEIGEYEARVAAYPTDLTIKFELGKRYFDAERFNDAIDLLQQAKDDTRNRASVLSYLGRAFAAINWHEEAVGTYRLALEGLADPNDAAAMDLRYGLMCSLQKHADDQKDVAAADEALKLAQQIAVQQISFKDVRARRDEIKALIARLKSS